MHSGEHASDTCRFCQQPLGAARRSALEAHFNDAFATFQRELTTLLSKLQAAKQNAGSLRLPEASRFYDSIVSEVTTASASVSEMLSATEAAIDVLISRVEAKRDNPFAPAAAAPAYATQPSNFSAAVDALNALVDKHNKTSNDFKRSVVDEAQSVAVMMEKYEVVRDMYHGFDYASALTGTAQERLVMMAGAIEWILDLQQKLAAKEKTEDGKKSAHRRYQDAVLALSKAFALASASDEAREIREEIGFFQAIRAALVKSSTGSGVTQQERELAIQQIVSRAVVSTEIVDILAAAGIKSPDISILSDEFLAEVQQMEKKNLALEALRKLINDGIRSRSKANVVQTKAFSERLEDAVARYHANAITTAEVLQELIQLAKDIRAARQRGEESGLSDEEIAFYDALAENESAVQMMGDDKLRLIAHELLMSLRENVSVDWAHRDSARARMRVLVKRILRKYGYPPDLQDTAVQTVLQQAEALSAGWSVARTGQGSSNG